MIALVLPLLLTANAAVRADAGPAKEPSDRVATGNIVVPSGETVHDVTAFHGNVEISPGAKAHLAMAIWGSVSLDPGATVTHDAIAFGGTVSVAPGATVTHDAIAFGGKVSVAPGASIGHDAAGIAGPVDSRGHVGHDTLSLGGGDLAGLFWLKIAGLVGLTAALSPFLLLWSALARFVVYFCTVLILHAFWPRRIETLAAALPRRPGASILAGLAALVGLPLLAILFVVTLVGIPLAVLEALAVAAVTAFGFSALALLVGRALPWGKGNMALQLALGTLTCTVATAVPFVGPLAGIAGWLWIFGAAVRTRLGHPLPPGGGEGPAPAAVA